jgi:hypothetical protein
VWNRFVDDWDRDEVFFSDISCFADSGLDVCAFGDTDTDFVFAVADDDKCFEAEAATTFDDTCDTVDVDHDFFKFFWCLWGTFAPVIAATTPTLLTAA